MNGSLVVTTMDKREDADKIATFLVQKRFVACANIAPICSVYWWKGKIEKSEEFLVILKTLETRLGPLTKALVNLHPYEVPEVVELRMKNVNESYLAWMRESVKTRKRGLHSATGKRRRPRTPPKRET